MKKFLRSKNGQALTEFALVLPILVVLIFGGIDLLTTASTNSKVESFYNDLAYELITNCPETSEVWKTQASGTDWEKATGKIAKWENSLVATIADYSSLSEQNFTWLSKDKLSADNDNKADFIDPTGQDDAQQFRIEKLIDTNNKTYFRVAFQYRQTSVSSYIFGFAFQKRYNKTLYCSK